MAAVRGSNTTPERLVRSTLHRLGYRYRLHDRRLPGRPDMSFPSRRVALFVHGCFWHRHSGCKRASTPVAHQDYWQAKFERNVLRDSKNQRALEEQGWRVIIVWECQLRNGDWIVPVQQALNLRRGTKTPSAAQSPDVVAI